MHAAAGLVNLGPGEALVLWTVPLIHTLLFSVLLARRVERPL
jgi:cytochrome c-type biogenesis protein CcmH/NrfF